MITTNASYKSIISGRHTFECQIIIGTGDSAKTFGMSSIRSLKITGGLFSGSTLSFGGCFAREVEVEFYPTTYSPPRMAEIEVQFRAKNSSQASVWYTAGHFFFDTRDTDDSGVMTVKGYDVMLKAEKTYIDPGDVGNWPKKMSAVAADIASKMGVTVDARSTFKDYDVQLPTEYTMREVLGYIAAAHCANWVVTPAGTLRMIAVGDTVDSVTLGKNVMTFESGREQSDWTHVIINTDDETYVEAVAATDDGRTLELSCPWGTTAMAQNILDALDGYAYRPYSASGALIDPAAEIGDTVVVNSVTSVLAACETTFDTLCAADISAPSEDEIDHEYPYISSVNRQIKRRLKTIETTLYVGTESIVATVKDIDGRISEITQTADKINWLVKSGTSESDFTMTDRAIEQVAEQITLTGYVTFNDLAQTGKTTINGGNITTGKISADRIDASELRVSRIYSDSYTAMYANGRTIYIGGTYGDLSFSEISLASNKVTIGETVGSLYPLEFNSITRAISGGTGVWTIGTELDGFKALYLSAAYGSGVSPCKLTAISYGTANYELAVNDSRVLTVDDPIDKIASGSNYINLSGTVFAPKATGYNLGTSSNFWANAYIESLKICYSSVTSITLACNSSGKLTIGGTEYSGGSSNALKSGDYTVSLASKVLTPGSSDAYDLGTSSVFWSNAYIKSLKICYSSTRSVALACNSNGQLTVGGSVFGESLTSLIPSANDTYNLGSSSKYWDVAYVSSLQLCYSTSRSIALACDSSGKLTVGGTVLDPSSSGSVTQLKNNIYDVSLSTTPALLPGSSGTYDLGSTSYFWKYLYVKTIRLYYNSYTYVDLACNSSSKLTSGGKVVTTA